MERKRKSIKKKNFFAFKNVMEYQFGRPKNESLNIWNIYFYLPKLYTSLKRLTIFDQNDNFDLKNFGSTLRSLLRFATISIYYQNWQKLAFIAIWQKLAVTYIAQIIQKCLKHCCNWITMSYLHLKKSCSCKFLVALIITFQHQCAIWETFAKIS